MESELLDEALCRLFVTCPDDGGNGSFGIILPCEILATSIIIRSRAGTVYCRRTLSADGADSISRT
eukprot:750624-Pleurochrysis_carterae.AAC.3